MTTAQHPPRWLRRAFNRSAAYEAASTPDERLAKAFDWLRAAIRRQPEPQQPVLADQIAAVLAARAAELGAPAASQGVIRHDD